MPTTLYTDKLSESGLSLDDAQTLHFEHLTSFAVKDLNSCHKDNEALKLNYYDPFGKPLQDIPFSDPFYRLRYLYKKAVERKGFAAVTKPKKRQAYDNPPRTVPVAYWPQNFQWAPVLDDPLVPVVFVEGELKAAKGCKEGFPTIGLAGVHNFQAKKRGIDFIESLNYLNYVRRDVYVCFDSDYLYKKDVLLGLAHFTEKLDSLGAFVHIITLPALPGEDKTGLDDFLVDSGDKASQSFSKLIIEAQFLGYCKALFEMNRKYVILDTPSCVYEKKRGTKHKPESFKNLKESHKKARVRVPAGAEKGSDFANYTFKEVCVAEKWLSWPLSDRCCSLVYFPGEGEYVENTLQDETYIDYNCWQGWGAKPVEGDVSLFLELIDFLFKDAETKHKEWFLQWLAYPIQHPGAKLYTACVVHGTKQGTGKTLVGYTVGDIYGDNYKEANQDALESDFHKPFMNRQFILGDEITGSDHRKFGDKLKQYITGSEILINEKFVPQYYIKNCINFYFTSNHPDAFYLEDTDRRFFIHKTPDYTLDAAFYKKYDRWYRTQDNPPRPRPDAANALMYYFLNLDTSSFEPHAPAPNTHSKDTMLDLAKSELGSWVHQATQYPDETLCLSKRDLFSSCELLLLYDPMDKTRVSAKGLSRELSRSAVPKCYGGKFIRTKTKVFTYFILRNHEKWLAATLDEIKDHIQNTPAFVNSEGGKY